MVDSLRQLDVAKMTWALFHRAFASDTSVVLGVGAKPWIVDALEPGISAFVVRNFRIDLSHAHFLNLVRAEQAELD